MQAGKVVMRWHDGVSLVASFLSTTATANAEVVLGRNSTTDTAAKANAEAEAGLWQHSSAAAKADIEAAHWQR